MEVTEIVFLSAVIAPALITAAVMIFVRIQMKKNRHLRRLHSEQADKDSKLINTLTEVVETQTNVIELYRENIQSRHGR